MTRDQAQQVLDQTKTRSIGPVAELYNSGMLALLLALENAGAFDCPSVVGVCQYCNFCQQPDCVDCAAILGGEG